MTALIEAHEPSQRPIASRLRALVRTTSPELRECVKWGSPMWVGQKNVLCLMMYPDHVNLGFFRGAELAHKHPEVEGTGKGLRHVKVRSLEDAARPVLGRLIREATRLDREALPRTRG